MAKKYIKNEKGIVRIVTSDNLQLEKPLLNENYDINVHNRNMDKIDSAIQEVKGKIDGLELVASNVKMADGTTVEDTVSANKTSILNNTVLANQALTKANEAFLRGDNVKTQLVDKLISEGLEVSTNNTFEELINGIALGKKWASGEISTWIAFPTQNYTWSEYKVNYSLDFVPSKIFVHCTSISLDGSLTGNRNIGKNTIFSSFTGQTEINSQYPPCILRIKDVNNSSFTIELYNNTIGGGYIVSPITWYAFE